MSFHQNHLTESGQAQARPIFKSLKRQVVHEVLDFSSQYGHDMSRSYTVNNIVGEPSVYPSYGDFTQALVFRTYGKWWHQCPSAPKAFKQSESSFTSNDFVDLKFVEPVFPTQIEIYETYNPGAVVRILACNNGEDNNDFHPRWFVLWSGTWQQCPPKARIFSPTLRKCPFRTRQLRLEFNQLHSEYYTELDALCLYGLESELEYNEKCHQGNETRGDAVENLTNCFETQMSIKQHENNSIRTGDASVHFLSLPSEVINKVFSYLKFSDLGNVAKTCKCFRNFAYDPLWFKEFDLQPYWSKINDSDLQLLGGRCGSTERLSLSWCGLGGLISSTGFSSFLQQLTGSLRCLYLSCCRFLDRDSLSLIKNSCPELEELDLSSCVEIPSESFHELSNLTCLTRLNLYRTQITDDALAKITRNCTKLRHLNLGGCNEIKNCGKSLNSLKFCPNIISLDLWRAKNLTRDDLKEIADNAPNLEEIDLGWCFANLPNVGVSYLVKRCQKLKKLFLSAVRSVHDDILIAISENCPLMEQLDIVGTTHVSKSSVERVLHECKHMRYFDLSFCTLLDEEWFQDARARFPNVALKKSVVSTD